MEYTKNTKKRYYDSLYKKYDSVLDKFAKNPIVRNISVKKHLEEEGISRRDFMKWVSATTATLMLPPSFVPLVARASELMNRLPVIWLECQDCAGNSEALLRSNSPNIDEIIFNTISLEYHETLMSPAGYQAEEQLEEAAKTFSGKYVLFVEGSIPIGDEGKFFGTIGAKTETFEDRVIKYAQSAAMIVAVGSCAAFGGAPAANPNPTNAVGVWDVISRAMPIVNIPACPANPVNIVGTLLTYVLSGQIPDLDYMLRPEFAFGSSIHGSCERKEYFDRAEFVNEWGDDGAKNGWCLFLMGCKGPMSKNNCPKVKYNEGLSWPIEAGHGCIGCSEPDFWDQGIYSNSSSSHTSNASKNINAKDNFSLGVLSSSIIGIGTS